MRSTRMYATTSEPLFLPSRYFLRQLWIRLFRSLSPFFGHGGDYEEEGNEGESAPTVTYEDVQGHPAQYATGAEPAVSSTTHYDGHHGQGDGNV